MGERVISSKCVRWSFNAYAERAPCRDRAIQQRNGAEVAALLAGGAFLKWDFNVFTLEERSQGHSLW